MGYDPIAAVASGEEAVVAAVAHQPDVILMDIRLRGQMDGIQAAMAIRESLDTPIVYLTAYADEETIERAMVTGPFGYLVKPFNERELRAAIEIALYKYATDKQLAEERARRQAAEEFKLFVDGVQDYAIFLVDVAGRVASWNAGAERIYGYTSEEIVGRSAAIFHVTEAIESGTPKAELETAAGAGRVEGEGWRARKDGSRFWASTLITALRGEDGIIRGFGDVTRDMTLRRQAEVQVAEGAARMAAMVASALDCIVAIDLDGRVIEWNPAAEQTFGYRREEARGRYMADLIVPERLRERHRNGLARLRETGEGPILGKRLEVPAVTKDGQERLVELSIVRVPTGGPPTFTGFLRDITSRKEAENENARLYREAQQAIRARDEFLAIASHELRTPLSALILQLDGLQRAIHEVAFDGPTDRLENKVDRAVKNAGRLARLIDGLLDVSRIATGRLQLNLERVDASELLREVAERTSEEARRAGCALLVEADPGVTGEWDRMRLEQVFANLFSNALKYGRGKPIEAKLTGSAEHMRLTVRDYGIGISQEDVARIFGRFERAVPVEHYGGLGLGLYITR
jgi:hypothetical protein